MDCEKQRRRTRPISPCSLFGDHRSPLSRWPSARVLIPMSRVDATPHEHRPDADPLHIDVRRCDVRDSRWQCRTPETKPAACLANSQDALPRFTRICSRPWPGTLGGFHAVPLVSWRSASSPASQPYAMEWKIHTRKNPMPRPLPGRRLPGVAGSERSIESRPARAPRASSSASVGVIGAGMHRAGFGGGRFWVMAPGRRGHGPQLAR